jgi:hypothetical protein
LKLISQRIPKNGQSSSCPKNDNKNPAKSILSIIQSLLFLKQLVKDKIVIIRNNATITRSNLKLEFTIKSDVPKIINK